MMGLWASGLRSLRPLASTHSVPRLTTPSFSPHINPFRKNSKLKQNILWFGLSFVQISCRKIQSFPFLVDFHSFLPKRARKYHTLLIMIFLATLNFMCILMFWMLTASALVKYTPSGLSTIYFLHSILQLQYLFNSEAGSEIWHVDTKSDRCEKLSSELFHDK